MRRERREGRKSKGRVVREGEGGKGSEYDRKESEGREKEKKEWEGGGEEMWGNGGVEKDGGKKGIMN